VRLLVSALVQVPTVVGWLRPVVLAPVGALGGLPAEHLEALLLHDLAHILRHDYLADSVPPVPNSRMH
jgi:bla regulator protein blaR1